MPVRLPPENRVPPVARSRGAKRKIVTYSQHEASLPRRLVRRILSPPVLIVFVFVTTVTIGLFGYYWWLYSARIDKLLKGEIFTRSPGIYAAPKELHTGEAISSDE